MESIKGKIRFYLGEYEVVEAKFPGAVTINLGNNVHITIHPGGNLPLSVKPGDRLPLYTEIPLAQPSQPPKQ